MKWIRVDYQNPCPICNRQDWCSVSSDGKYVCCARVESPIRLGDAGYIHPNKTKVKIVKPVVTKPSDWKKVWNEAIVYELCYNMVLLQKSLGLQNLIILNHFSIRYHRIKNCYLIPMVDGKTGKIVGIQERYLNGVKKATAGSKLGLFIPVWLDCFSENNKQLVICEGFSDTATMTDIGFDAIGRPSCSTGTENIISFLRDCDYTKIYIAADNDKVGIDGAIKLRKSIIKEYPNIKVTIVIPPPDIKDIRDWRKKNPDFAKNFLQTTEI